MCNWEGQAESRIRGKGILHEQTPTLGNEWVEHPSPGTLPVGYIPTWLP